jgi:hypothetical protein
MHEVNGVKWLTKLDELSTASETSLCRSLLTSDGCGVQFKKACLNELLKRVHNGWVSNDNVDHSDIQNGE